MASAPPVDEDFVRDLEEIRRGVGPAPGDPWDSDHTSVLVAFERGDLAPDVVTVGSAISVVTVSEMLHGVHRASGELRAGRHAAVEHLLLEYQAVEIIVPVARVHAAVSAELAGTGALVRDHDLWIGATALTYGLGVMTRNARDFARLPGLRVVTV
jgi:tRNA(fMet)-specific endonuclease VapC